MALAGWVDAGLAGAPMHPANAAAAVHTSSVIASFVVVSDGLPAAAVRQALSRESLIFTGATASGRDAMGKRTCLPVLSPACMPLHGQASPLAHGIPCTDDLAWLISPQLVPASPRWN